MREKTPKPDQAPAEGQPRLLTGGNPQIAKGYGEGVPIADNGSDAGREANRRIEAEDALRHGQRLEALGQLTGGVAHDFNNLLTVIRASVDMLRRPDLPEPRRQRYIDAISNTVNRAAKLTNQLLAFARRQTLKPEVFDACQNVRTLSEMIATLIGSRIEITAQVPDKTCLVNADAGDRKSVV